MLSSVAIAGDFYNDSVASCHKWQFRRVLLTDPTLIDLECFLVSFSCFNLAEKLVSKVKIEWKLTIACLFVFCCFFCSFVNSDYYFILIFFY